MTRRHRAILAAIAGLATLGASTTATAVCPPGLTTLQGTVQSGTSLAVQGRNAPLTNPPALIAQATVRLFAAAGDQELGRVTSDGAGSFEICYVPPANDPVLYLVARGGAIAGSPANENIALMAVLGTAGQAPRTAVVNELTTVASVWTAAQLFDGATYTGNELGIRLAAANVPNLVDVATSGYGEVLLDAVNAPRTTTLGAFNALGNLLATCVRDAAACSALFTAATPPGATPPADTLAAAVAVARHPWANVSELFALQPQDAPVYVPILAYPPSGWTLSLHYVGGGLDAPGAIAFDARGNPWTTNNFLLGASGNLLGPLPPSVSSRSPSSSLGFFTGLGVSYLGADGRPRSPAFGFQGGGIDGSGFGIALDRDGFVWIGNVAGAGGVSKLDPQGRAVSGSPFGTGTSVQGIAIDREGNVWSAAFSADAVVVFPGGDPGAAVSSASSPDCRIGEPFDVAIDPQGDAWVTNSSLDSVTRLVFDPAARTLRCPETYPVGAKPLGLAVDSRGNVWVSNWVGSSVTSIAAGPAPRVVTTYTDGIDHPWGIAIDGADLVWVPEFQGQALVALCGLRPESCPAGVAPGQPISVAGGYRGGGAIQNLTGATIDPAGNVWVANNVHDFSGCFPELFSPGRAPNERRAMDCGGDGLVVFFGLAAPVAVPMFGPPQQP